jgi:hypothetical protein
MVGGRPMGGQEPRETQAHGAGIHSISTEEAGPWWEAGPWGGRQDHGGRQAHGGGGRSTVRHKPMEQEYMVLAQRRQDHGGRQAQGGQDHSET